MSSSNLRAHELTLFSVKLLNNCLRRTLSFPSYIWRHVRLENLTKQFVSLLRTSNISEHATQFVKSSPFEQNSFLYFLTFLYVLQISISFNFRRWFPKLEIGSTSFFFAKWCYNGTHKSHACAPRVLDLTPGVHQHLIGGRHLVPRTWRTPHPQQG